MYHRWMQGSIIEAFQICNQWLFQQCNVYFSISVFSSGVNVFHQCNEMKGSETSSADAPTEQPMFQRFSNAHVVQRE